MMPILTARPTSQSVLAGATASFSASPSALRRWVINGSSTEAVWPMAAISQGQTPGD